MKPRTSDKHHRQLELDLEPRLRQLLPVDEIFASADETLLRELSEDGRIERKSSKFSGEKLGQYLSMWANTAPDGGIIVLGQEDDGEFTGLKQLNSHELNDRESVGTRFCPDANLKVRRVPVTNDRGESDFVMLLRVAYHSSLVIKTTGGKAFIRRGSSRCELKPDEIRELQADKGELSFEGQPCRLTWPDEFDNGLVQTFVDAVRNARRIPLDQSMEQVLELRRLGRIRNGEFTPNLACGLLFAIDPGRIVPGCKIRFLRFEGEVEGSGRNFNAVKDEIIEGPLPRLLADFEKVLESQLRTFSPLDASMKFFPVPEYPKEAWYEAIVNACVHRSYGNGLKNMPIFVKMFDDRLVIESPGPFPPFVTPENIFEQHHPRNPHLMEAMFYLDFVRCAREGTRRIRDTMKELKLPPPEFAELSHDGPPVVRVTLRNNVKQRRAWIDRDVSQIIGEALASKFSEHERRVLNLVAANGTITISDAHKVLDISWASAKRLLLSLARQHVLQYVRFRPLAKDKRDPRAFFRLWSTAPLPDGAFEPDEFKTAPRGGKSSPRH